MSKNTKLKFQNRRYIMIPPMQENTDIRVLRNFLEKYCMKDLVHVHVHVLWYYFTTYAFVICLLMKMIRAITTSKSRKTPIDITVATTGITIAPGPAVIIMMQVHKYCFK